jgi:hypothetical protein
MNILPQEKEEVLVKLDNGLYAVAFREGDAWCSGEALFEDHENGNENLSGKVVAWSDLPDEDNAHTQVEPPMDTDVLVRLANGFYAVAHFSSEDDQWLTGSGVFPSHESGSNSLSDEVASWDELPEKMENELEQTQVKKPKM